MKWTGLFLVLMFSNVLFAQTDSMTSEEEKEITLELESSGNDAAALEDSADENVSRSPQSESFEPSLTESSSSSESAPAASDIGELTLSPEDEQMAEVPPAQEAIVETTTETNSESTIEPTTESASESVSETKIESTLPVRQMENKAMEPMAVPATETQAQAAPASDLGPVVGDQKYKITCQLNDDVREITAITQADGSVGVLYKRFGTVRTIAIAKRDPAYADQVVDKIYNNLANGTYPYACTKE